MAYVCIPEQEFTPEQEFYYLENFPPLGYYYPPTPPPSFPQLDCQILKLKLNREQMHKNGYPMIMFNEVHIEPNEYQRNRKMFVSDHDLNRVCVRCCTHFSVEPSGLQKRSDTPICRDRTTGNLQNFHITDQQSETLLKKFEFAPSDNSNIEAQMFAIDVEMVFTARGQAVGRVTLIHQSGQTLVDELVRPKDEVFDPMTRYSGLVIEDFANATETLESVRYKLFQFITTGSILVGHGLYGDLKALGIIHHNVIDTSVIFSYNGRRPSLRHLASRHLGWQIQQETHCSQEDALASLSLVFFGAENPQFLAEDFKHLLMRF